MSEHEALAQALAGATFQQYAAALLQIENEKGELVPFELNEAQKVVYSEIKRQQHAGRPVRILILKGRQQGMSTLSQMRLAWWAFTRPGVRCLTVGHNLAAVHDLYGKFERAHRSLPDILRPDVEPGGERGRRMKFADPNRSAYRADSAHDPEGVGRGMTVQVAHLTEIPQWSKPDETMQAVLATIPDDPDTEVLVETTAKGASGWFYETWIAAMRDMEKGIEPEFVPVFVPWYKTARYKRARRPGEPTLDRREVKFRDEYGLTNEQVYWYRDQRRKYGERVTEEYPSRWEEAFLSSGLPFFRREILEFYRENRLDPLKIGSFKAYPGTGKFAFRAELDGATHLFEPPQPGHRYSIGVDYASGRAKDSSAIVVIDIETKKVVATHQSKWLPDDVNVEAYCLGWMYQHDGQPALLIPERNGIGQALVDRLVNDFGYPNIYIDTESTTVRSSRGRRYGWATSNASRKWLIEEMAHFIHGKLVTVPCTRLVDEMHTFVYTDEEGEHAAALDGSHDDLVMAFAIALRGVSTAPTIDPQTVTPRHRKRHVLNSRTGY
jgi:hypothetical protein